MILCQYTCPVRKSAKQVKYIKLLFKFSNRMIKRQDFSKKIIKILSGKRALSLQELHDQVNKDSDGYAFKRSLNSLKNTGLVEESFSGQNQYAFLTRDGRKKAHSIKLDNENTLVSMNWDGKWRIILLDIPENRKAERESLRYLLKKAGFVCLKNSVWISPLTYEHLFMNIKKDFELTTEIMIFVTDTIDPETEKEFFSLVQ